MAYTFIISDESVNSNGFSVLTRGIDLTRFVKNPVMLYMHERDGGVIGRWENIRVSGTQLLADAVFDESDPIGKRVRERVEGGFLRSASIGISDVVQENLKGVETVIKCVLNEVSVVDIPSNQNAVKLLQRGGKCVYRLSDLKGKQNTDFRGVLLDTLGLAPDAKDEDILEEIKRLVSLKSSTEDEVNKALKYGFIDKSEVRLLHTLAKSDSKQVINYLNEKRGGSLELINNTVLEACNAGKFTWYDRSVFEEIGAEMGVKTLTRLLSSLSEAIRITDIIEGGKDSNKSSWGLDEYRKYAPQELKNNPKLYEKLLQKSVKTTESYSLDYYRKNNPKYLEDNPETYKRMIEKDL